MLRICSGNLRGRKIPVYDEGTIRPLTIRARDSLLNRIQFEIPGAIILDAFAGSGIFGIEGLSRGATHVTFLESDIRAVKQLQENLKKLDLQGHSNIESGDLFRKKRISRQDYTVIFADPPFDKEFCQPFLTWLRERDLLKNCGILALKHEKTTEMLPIPDFTEPETRHFSGVSITIYRRV
jgi:16S rRNA (guanine966-N2)-methyltransferase